FSYTDCFYTHKGCKSNHFISFSLAAFLQPLKKYCVSCDWVIHSLSQGTRNSLVSCDLCDHSQISHVVSIDVRSDILLTTLHVITAWPISDHMIGTNQTEVP
ncbi:unnamed protein product, partial [Staurois parvus]